MPDLTPPSPLHCPPPAPASTGPPPAEPEGLTYHSPGRSTARQGGAQPWLTVAGGVAVTAVGIAAGVLVETDFTAVLGMAAAIGAPMLTIRRLWSQLGWGKWWRKRLKGRLGRIAFRLGGIGLGEQPLALPAEGERTEVALGHAAEQLFAALPAEQRARIGDIPAVLAKLEADALVLRERQRDNPRVSMRLSTAVAALESMRLDLLRLHAGDASLDELTQDLQAARRVSEQIDRELLAKLEVEDLLKEP